MYRLLPYTYVQNYQQCYINAQITHVDVNELLAHAHVTNTLYLQSLGVQHHQDPRTCQDRRHQIALARLKDIVSKLKHS